MDDALLDRLRDDLAAADYRASTVSGLLGAPADEARQRGVFEPARIALSAREPGGCEQLIRLFLLGEALDDGALARALPRLGGAGAIELGLVAAGPDGYRAVASLNPIELPVPVRAGTEASSQWWLLSDLDDQLRRGPARSDHVMGVGGATRSLLAHAPLGAPLGAALDLGTGCGIIALVLARAGADRVVATDLSERALRFARANARLNGLEDSVEFLQGDLFAPVAGEFFDLILSNPPFVITPRLDDTVPRYEYRDAGLAGDELAAAVVSTAPKHLAEGGTVLCLANWEYHWGGSGLDRVRDWVDSATNGTSIPLAAWVIERDRLDPARYAETWVRDGGARPGDPEFDLLMGAWLRDFSSRRVTSVGMGAVRVRRLHNGRGSALVRLESAPGALSPDAGESLESAMTAGLFAVQASDEEMLGRRWVRTDAVTELREHVPGQDAPRSISLRVDSPIARTVAADPLLAAAVGGCDGDLTLGQISDALASILELDAAECSAALVDGVRELAWLSVLMLATE